MYYITKLVYDEYIKAKNMGKTNLILSLDLGKSKTLITIAILDKIFTQIKKIKEHEIYIYDNSKVFKPIISLDSIYSLALDENGYPTLYIDGVKMNVGKEEGVEKYNQSMIKNLRLDNKTDNVLEICTGLGYKTILLSDNALKVTTIEKSQDVVDLAKLNPYSQPLFNRKNIKLLIGNACDVIKTIDDNSFSRIVHDPPTFKFAPELYADEFYLDLYRVAKDRAVLFHYTGMPGSRFRGNNIIGTTKNKLNDCGWRVYKESEMGLYAIKD